MANNNILPVGAETPESVEGNNPFAGAIETIKTHARTGALALMIGVGGPVVAEEQKPVQVTDLSDITPVSYQKDETEAISEPTIEMPWLKKLDVSDPTIVRFIEERIPGYQYYRDGLKAFAELSKDQQMATLEFLEGAGGGEVALSDEMMTFIRNLIVSPEIRVAILDDVIAVHGEDSREVKGVGRALDKLAAGEFGASWEKRLLRDGGDKIKLLPEFVGLSLDQERIQIAEQRLDDANQRLDIAEAELKVIQDALAIGREIISSGS